MSFFDKFKKKPEWEKEINAFLKEQGGFQADIDSNFVENACYLTFVRGKNDKLYSIAATVSEENPEIINVFVCKYKFDDISKLKEIAMEIVENQKRMESGLEPDGFCSAEQIIIEIGDTAVQSSEMKAFLNGVVDGSAYVKSDTYNTRDNIKTLSDDVHITAQALIELKQGETVDVDYHGFDITVENNEKTKEDKLNMIITKSEFPIGSVFVNKDKVLETLKQIDDGTLMIFRSTTYLQLEHPAEISKITAFNKSQRAAWKIQDSLEKNEATSYTFGNFNMTINADVDGYELAVAFADNEDVVADFKNFELFYELADKFSFTQLAKRIQSVETESLQIPVMSILDKAGEISNSSKESPISTKSMMQAMSMVGIEPMGKFTLHELNVVTGTLYNIKPYVREFRQLEKERSRALENKTKS